VEESRRHDHITAMDDMHLVSCPGLVPGSCAVGASSPLSAFAFEGSILGALQLTAGACGVAGGGKKP